MIHVALLLLLLQQAISYKYQHRFIHRHQSSKIYQLEKEDTWGVSFIGQDVCGSKYNDDPFSEIDKKPDAFEIFQKRLNAIEEKRNNNKTLSNANAGKWP